eukprot:CAMPEP_0176124690 /NCGR_PEP_ID=MMETSP0120_2-20121206/62874_1 /TAXON_ID=160619 /ORGANISM="Kryptoperidinium foliaceum, Strain CCMP 1326" /LENGTH=61 /DNA_ID=CAMNT_0017459481 /DNA_START=343 /DNA_END=525 /DNA_ORIENTATION=-
MPSHVKSLVTSAVQRSRTEPCALVASGCSSSRAARSGGLEERRRGTRRRRHRSCGGGGVSG